MPILNLGCASSVAISTTNVTLSYLFLDLSFTDKVLTTIALSIILAALIAAVWMLVHVVWSVIDWIVERGEEK